MSGPLPEDENRRLESWRDSRISETSPEPMFDDFVRLASITCDTPIAVIAIVDEQRVWFKAKIGIPLDQVPRDHAFCTHTIQQSGVLAVLDPLADDRFTSGPLVTEAGIRFYAGAPLITGNQQCIGALAVMDRVPHLLTSEQVDSLQIIARRVVRELEQRRTGGVQLPHPRLQTSPSRHPGTTILLVEHDAILRNLLHRSLEGNGFSVFPAPDSVEALRLSLQHNGKIDIVVSDIVMQRSNGLELSEQIRATRPETKFLFTTGFGDQFPRLHELVKNGTTVLEKPFLPSELVRKLEGMLNLGNAAMAIGR